MNEKQQELYEKLLKKVNEYCLGQAAEDVIAAIDDLVDNYETPKVDSIIKNEYYLGTEKVSQQVYETIQMYKQLVQTLQDKIYVKEMKYAKQEKALEIIKTKNIDAEDVKVFKTYSSFNQRRSLRGLIGIKKEEYELLKEILK